MVYKLFVVTTLQSLLSMNCAIVLKLYGKLYLFMPSTIYLTQRTVKGNLPTLSRLKSSIDKRNNVLNQIVFKGLPIRALEAVLSESEGKCGRNKFTFKSIPNGTMACFPNENQN
ncbi:hypothetical protein LAZ67_2005822 [Cordylochernes scorpioides]|uniref:Uncharacterized protein n=1 Tax=Cordylochernes scorpioides TaxID=51811 RepID=A0ABY6K6B2_9ARAC|nr:hypothetical protein LAZ67_2005822 [Cordylochernes scorpioides]